MLKSHLLDEDMLCNIKSFECRICIKIARGRHVDVWYWLVGLSCSVISDVKVMEWDKVVGYDIEVLEIKAIAHLYFFTSGV